MTFVRGIKKQTSEPIIVKQGDEEIDRFNGIWRYMKAKRRAKVLLVITGAIARKNGAIDELIEKKTADKKHLEKLQATLDQGDELSPDDKKAFDNLKDQDFEPTDQEIIDAWEPIENEIFELVKKQLIKCTFNEGDDRSWEDSTLEEVWEYPEYRNAFINTLSNLAKGEYSKAKDAKN